jgi:acetyl-CoA carboxylase biotin carboxylase subunit
MNLFKKILVANRGEIAVRVIRAAQEMGIKAVAVYSAADKEALHVRRADEAYSLGGDLSLAETYLDINKIVGIAKAAGCQAIHPGYGFLSENSEFVKACDEAGIVFIGPNARAMKLMGNKIESREALKDAGIPMTAGITGDIDTLLKRAKEIPFPIMIKAAAGGGGKGMRIVHDDSNLAELLESTSREAKSYFGDGTVFIEKYIEEPRHIEIQVLGDNYGHVIHLFERECSIQRRHQKIIEESPSPTLTPEIRKQMGETAVRIAQEIGYNNAGTVEFLVDKNLMFYFLEMNTRVQVEHPVTEMVTGIDIVKEQILIASGKALGLKQEDIKQNGHAIECRIYAEDPENNFLPSPGKMSYYRQPEGEGIRIDSGIDRATTIESFYDPMICKLVCRGEDRDIARERTTRALDHFIIHGIRTNITYLKYLMGHTSYKANTLSTKFCDEHGNDILAGIRAEKAKVPDSLPVIAFYLYEFTRGQQEGECESYNVWKHIGYWREVMELSGQLDGKEYSLAVDKIHNGSYFFRYGDSTLAASVVKAENGQLTLFSGDRLHPFYVSVDDSHTGYVSINGSIFKVTRNDVLTGDTEILGSFDAHGKHEDGKIVSPMPGKVIKVNVKEGDEVKKGTTLLIVEAMKMENYITAPGDGIIEKVNVKVGEMVNSSIKLIEFKPVTE